MTASQLDVSPHIQPERAPTDRSTGALIVLLICALPLPLCLLGYHFILWFMEQMAIASGSLAVLAWAGLIGLAAQAGVTFSLVAALWYFTKDERFKPIYAGWLGTTIMAFPALGLRLLG